VLNVGVVTIQRVVFPRLLRRREFILLRQAADIQQTGIGRDTAIPPSIPAWEVAK
jgi:hypothetical protein